MNISYKWLKRYIDFNLSPHELAAVLTQTGLECDTVEEIETIRGGLKGLVVGEVLTCEAHPNSDHLHITTVNIGGEEPLQIVCGAPNVAAGQKVIVATVGTTLYKDDEEFKIKKSKIRGTESCGMICAEDEIGIGTDHAGIMVLANDAVPGTPASEYFKVESDYALEVELTPNRVDAASHYGVARDMKAFFACKAAEGEVAAGSPDLRCPDVSPFAPDKADGAVAVEVLDTEGAPRYSGVTIRGVQVKESPEWLKNLLIAAGQRPINNVVDITNFILLGIGQPLHSFDLSKVAGEKIVVRTCPAGTKFTTLDGQERTLHEADLMICDTEKPMCIAGVFGGLESGVTQQTTDLFIESAWFNSTRIRRTARRHGLSTDASFRYERGTDPEITVYAAKLAALLIKELAGGEICGDIVDIYPNPAQRVVIDFDLDYCATLIGKRIPTDIIRVILESLDIRILSGSDNKTLKIEIPLYRVDVTRPCDVVEEILRIYGYNNVEFGMEMHANLSDRNDVDASYDMQNLISEQLAGEGYNEIMSNSLSSLRYYEDNTVWPVSSCVTLMNPLSSDLAVMRRTLLFGGLEAISRNFNRKIEEIRMFEYGNIYSLNPEKEITTETPLAPFKEEQVLGIWLSGVTHATWNRQHSELTIFDLKSTLYKILRRMGVSSDKITETQGSDDIFSVKLDLYKRNGKQVGTIGLIRTSLLKKFDIETEVAYCELKHKELMKLSAHAIEFTPLEKTLPVRRDLALLLDSDVKFSLVEENIRKSEKRLLRSVELFDVYEGKNLPEGKKSYAVAIRLQDSEKTLNDKQIDAIMNKIITNLRRDLGAQLR